MPSLVRPQWMLGGLRYVAVAARGCTPRLSAGLSIAGRPPHGHEMTRGPSLGWVVKDFASLRERRVLPLLPGSLTMRFASGTPEKRRSDENAAGRGSGMVDGAKASPEGRLPGRSSSSSSSSKPRGARAAGGPRSSAPLNSKRDGGAAGDARVKSGRGAEDPRSSSPLNSKRDGGAAAADDGGKSGSGDARAGARKGKQATTAMDTVDQIKLNRAIMANDSLPHLAKLCASESQRYDAVNTAAAIGRISKLIGQQKLQSHADQDAVARAVRALGRRAIELMASFQPRQINALLGAHAKLSKHNLVPSGELMDAVRWRALERIEGFAPMHTSHTVWALSMLVPHGGEQELVVALCRRAMATMGEFKAMEVPSMLLGIAR